MPGPQVSKEMRAESESVIACDRRFDNKKISRRSFRDIIFECKVLWVRAIRMGTAFLKHNIALERFFNVE